MRLFSLPLLLQPVPQRSLRLCPALELFPLQTQRLICIHSSALIYISTKQSQLWRCLLSFPSTFKHLQETFLIGCCGKYMHTHTQMCTRKYTHARSTQTPSSRSNFVNHLLNPAFLYSSTEPNMDNCMRRWWDTCSALTFLNLINTS